MRARSLARRQRSDLRRGSATLRSGVTGEKFFKKNQHSQARERARERIGLGQRDGWLN